MTADNRGKYEINTFVTERIVVDNNNNIID